MATGSNSKLKAESKCGESFSKTHFFPQNLAIFFRKNENIETEYSLLIFYFFKFSFWQNFAPKKHSSRHIIPHNWIWPWKLEPGSGPLTRVSFKTSFI